MAVRAAGCLCSPRALRVGSAVPIDGRGLFDGGGQLLPAPHSRKQYTKDPKPERSNGHLIALDSDVALNAAWARRAGMIYYLPRSARVGRCATGGGAVVTGEEAAVDEAEQQQQ